ncbi:hypothetical protein [Natrinema salifodinae]|uniref:Uncharacterized protein n=1 Tax=Natrinema salifodinae TaxID=1202768 RepID=A0A1I0MFN1_9EURY|nr:hypothetical protein [Natrinema salifodinae]SEV87237.1 hypothetical protein SAMN05216285_0918 [Natrinema salifodinae]
MNSTLTINEAMFMFNDTPNAGSILTEAYNVEPTTVDEIRNGADGLCRRMLPGEID